MKRTGILNSHISKILSDLGHTDMIVIADAGLPVPDGVVKVDLALKRGTPSFKEVVDVIREAMIIEKVIMASELVDRNPKTFEYLNKTFLNTNVEQVTHEQFKTLTSPATSSKSTPVRT
ncbi:D-ribose pyranase [Peribacillus huizhouensis]|uniref:D-ribose pyranase n=1 Tax=Peribacillus huizhouensis TaxID=1501239 RepID=A0ABR6CLH9_9BACI|nr:D-ribose pyranase [Peribacillus huizhouensis]MBA9025894.1 D-ribose pyranase [Peribacillus huizhouensis]